MEELKELTTPYRQLLKSMDIKESTHHYFLADFQKMLRGRSQNAYGYWKKHHKSKMAATRDAGFSPK